MNYICPRCDRLRLVIVDAESVCPECAREIERSLRGVRWLAPSTRSLDRDVRRWLVDVLSYSWFDEEWVVGIDSDDRD